VRLQKSALRYALGGVCTRSCRHVKILHCNIANGCEVDIREQALELTEVLKGEAERLNHVSAQLGGSVLSAHLNRASMDASGLFRLFSNKRSRIKDNREKGGLRNEARESYLASANCYVLLVERYPKRYPRLLSAYINSDSDTALFRRFSTLHARILYHKQVELTELEAQLDELDKEIEGQPRPDDSKWRLGHSISLASGKKIEKWRGLMEEINGKLKKYSIFPS
jgi:hypothetical protein